MDFRGVPFRGIFPPNFVASRVWPLFFHFLAICFEFRLKYRNIPKYLVATG
jgi:hypothetical protein